MYSRILCLLVCLLNMEGHLIPTEHGHPTQFRPMYRPSPLEIKKLQTQVSAFLKAGNLEPGQVSVWCSCSLCAKA
jgi:hypothetical protein